MKQHVAFDPTRETARHEGKPKLRPAAPHLRLLGLQTRVGNRAVASLVRTHLHPGKSPLAVMRVRVDLEERYKDQVEAAGEKKESYRKYLDDFKRMQDLLLDVPKATGYLRVLSTPGARNDLHGHLSAGEGAWAASKPILLANTSAFTSVLNKGQMFVDTVAPKHGVHAHRIQWNVIGQDIARGGYTYSAVQLFRESSRAWWRRYMDSGQMLDKGKYIWEQLLDTFGDLGSSGFTSPDAVTKFIAENADDAKLDDLSAGVKAAEVSRRDLRNERIEHYAASEHFKRLNEWAQGDALEEIVKRDDTFTLDGWTYTGFIRDAWLTPPGDVKPEKKQLVPTIAYPPGHDPEGRPA